MKKLILSMLCILALSSVVLAEETVTKEIEQVVNNENSYLGINVMKQPEQEGNKQLITNKKSFLFINIVVNGKPIEVKQK